MCVCVCVDILMGDSCGDPLIVMFKADEVAEDFLQDGGRESKRKREKERKSNNKICSNYMYASPVTNT